MRAVFSEDRQRFFGMESDADIFEDVKRGFLQEA